MKKARLVWQSARMANRLVISILRDLDKESDLSQANMESKQRVVSGSDSKAGNLVSRTISGDLV